VVSPVYITEISPARRRGLLVAIAQLNVVLGILAAYFSNYVVGRLIGMENPNVWRWMFGMMAVPSILFLVSTLVIPESPRWLVKRGRLRQAEEVLGSFGHENPAAETADIETSLRGELAGKYEQLFQRKYLTPLLLAFMVAAFNQLDGINAIIYYTADIFKMAGADSTSALMQSMVVGLTNMVMTIVGMLLIDRVGRKLLLLVGSITFAASHLLAAWCFYVGAKGWVVLMAMMGIVGSHAFSQGVVVWVIINELLPNAIRASGSAVISCSLWVLCMAVSWTFPVIVGASSVFAFVFFAVMMVLQFVLVFKFLPETKGKSLEDIQRLWKVSD